MWNASSCLMGTCCQGGHAVDVFDVRTVSAQQRRHVVGLLLGLVDLAALGL